MRYYKLFLLVICLSASQIHAERPQWTKTLPTPSNSTFHYVYEFAMGYDEDNARNKAMGLVMQNATQSISTTMTTKQIEDAISNGTLEVEMSYFNLPIKRVCTYRESIEGGKVGVHVLCQVANRGNVVPMWDEFTNCGDPGTIDNNRSNNRPVQWEKYTTSDYISSFQQAELEKGQKQYDLTQVLKDDARKELATKLGVSDTSSIFLQLIHTESPFVDKRNKTIYLVSYVRTEDLTNIHILAARETLEKVNNLMENAESYANEGNWIAAGENYKLAKKQVEKTQGILKQLALLDSKDLSKEIDKQRQTVTQSLKVIDAGVRKVQEHNNIDRTKKLMEFLRIAYDAEQQGNTGAALQYYYGAYVYKGILDNTDDIHFPNNTVPSLDRWLPNHIKELLQNIKVYCTRIPDNKREAKLWFLTNDGQKCNNIIYQYNVGEGYDIGTYQIKNGCGYIEISPFNPPKNVQVRIQYRYDDEWSDAELQSLLKDVPEDYGNFSSMAEYGPIPIVEESDVELLLTKSMPQNIDDAKKLFKEEDAISEEILQNEAKQFELSQEDAAYYTKALDKICSSIASKNYYSIDSTLFSEQGWQIYKALIRNGKATVRNATNYKLISFCGEVYARSIQMSFTFSGKKTILENVVFVFDKNRKVDGIQFALDDVTASNIMETCPTGAETAYTIANFIENYRTAFALKRLDYIESIFAEDAVIIIGRVVKKTVMSDVASINGKSAEDIHYSMPNKQEYIKRLARNFKNNEWINIKFANATTEYSEKNQYYGVGLQQDYYSSTYSDHGHLFLIVDFKTTDQPVILLRAWTPDGKFGFPEYDRMLHEKTNR